MICFLQSLMLEQNVNQQETRIFSVQITTTTFQSAYENSVHVYMAELLDMTQNKEEVHLKFMKKCGNDLYM